MGLIAYLDNTLTQTLLHKMLMNCKHLNYRVEKQNLQVERPIGFEHLNEIMVQNSSPTCKHNLFALIQSKKIFVRLIAMLESAKRLRRSKLLCAHLKNT